MKGKKKVFAIEEKGVVFTIYFNEFLAISFAARFPHFPALARCICFTNSTSLG